MLHMFISFIFLSSLVQLALSFLITRMNTSYTRLVSASGCFAFSTISTCNTCDHLLFIRLLLHGLSNEKAKGSKECEFNYKCLSAQPTITNRAESKNIFISEVFTSHENLDFFFRLHNSLSATQPFVVSSRNVPSLSCLCSNKQTSSIRNLTIREPQGARKRTCFSVLDKSSNRR